MNLLAIDSGIEKTGFAVFNSISTTGDPRLVLSGLIKTERSLTTACRLKIIYDELKKIIQKHKPERIIIERLFFFRNQKTAIQVSQAQGVVMLLCAQNSIPVEFLTPLQIKQIITGYGQSDKKSVQKMLELTFHVTIPASRDDEADAIACGLAYCYLNRKLLQ